MLVNLRVINLDPASDSARYSSERSLVLQTCRRVLIIDLLSEVTDFHIDDGEVYYGEMAYAFMLQVICGLKSNLIAESEIVRQFKKIYSSYSVSKNRDVKLMKIVERVFKDAKEIRTKHLYRVGGSSYSSLSRKIVKHYKAPKMLLIGSGDLARDVAMLCSKDTNISISARNLETAESLASSYKLDVVPWKDLDKWSQFDCIVNTIGAPITLLDETFFDSWKQKESKSQVFVDLGFPSIISTKHNNQSGVFRLDDIVRFSKENEEKNSVFVTNALSDIERIANSRIEYFKSILSKRNPTIFSEEARA